MSLSIAPRPATTTNHDQFEVRAEGLGRYTIDVSVPAGSARGTKGLPVILVTDGNVLFDLVRTILHSRFAQIASSVLPPSIIVGVGYPADEGLAGFFSRRHFDFHGEWDMTDPLGIHFQMILEGMKMLEGKPDLTMRTGGAEQFSSFIRDDLLPGLAAHYPIDLEARHTLIGESSGGHYVLRDVFDPRSPFSRYVCISPGFGSAPGSIERLEAEYAAGHDDLDADIFLCCGKVEATGTVPEAMAHFASGITWVAEQLAMRAFPSARVAWEVMDLEDHNSIAPRAVTAGLRSVHRLRPGVHDAELAEATLAAIRAMGVPDA